MLKEFCIKCGHPNLYSYDKPLFCAKCGKELISGQSFCSNCSEKISFESPSEETNTKERSTNKNDFVSFIRSVEKFRR